MAAAGQVRELFKNLGADLCGIAPQERFLEAPRGFRPTDIYEDCRSVVVFARKLPRQILSASNCIPYTHVNHMITQEVDALSIEASRVLEEKGIGSVPIPSDDPYEHWESQRQYGRAILSLRHAGWLAGLGVLGRNTLLMNNECGNMIQIGAVLVDAELDGDPLASYAGCPANCQLCLDSCPPGALTGGSVDQELCRPLSCHQNERGFILKRCHICRSICPHRFGIQS